MNNQGMSEGLGEFVRRHRKDRRLSGKQLAGLIGRSSQYVSQLEGGKIALPAADIRRRLAAALGVSHLDLLMAAGEIASDEIAGAGKQGVIPADPATEELIDYVRRKRFSSHELEFLRRTAESIRWLSGESVSTSSATMELSLTRRGDEDQAES